MGKNKKQNKYVENNETLSYNEECDDIETLNNKPQQITKKVISPMTKEAISMVNYYCDTILPGFSDDNWYNAAKCLKQLSAYLDLESYRMLGGLMSEMYAGPSTDRVSEVRKAVISALQNQ